MYVVKKPLNLRGKRRVIGEVIQESDVDKRREYSLVRAGYISRLDSGTFDLAEAALHAEPIRKPTAHEGCIEVNIPIIREEGTMALPVTPAAISDALRLLQTAAGEAVQEIKKIEDENILIVLDACDSRKTIKEAARSRAAVIHAGEDDEEDFGSEGGS